MSNSYNASNIKVLKGLEPVRKRPGMYIGSTDERGLHHLIWEIFDNCIDEVMAGYANAIEITLKKDYSIIIKDNGRGIPVDINQETKISAVETVFTVLHAGGKFDNDAYATAGGLHGVGASVVNALSEWLTCVVARNGKVYEAKFANGGSQIKQPLTEIGKSSKTGTIVHFKPDDTIFKKIQFNPDTIRERLRETSFLFKDLKIIFNDEINHKSDVFLSKNGINDFVKFINEKRNPFTSICYLSAKIDKIDLELSFQYCEDLDEKIISFANSIKTIEGGSHEIGFKTGLTEVINEYARKWNLLKSKEKNLDGNDLREGIGCVISIKIPENLISYEGQTKNKLFTPEAKEIAKKITIEKLSYWFEENKKDAVKIIEKAIQARNAKLAARKIRENIKTQKKSAIDKILSGKLTPAQVKDPILNELFLVEGDSAGGSAKLGRDKKYQAILPLKGKVINVEKANVLEVLKNEEIATIIASIGTGVLKNFDIKKLKYHKIIIMTDADTDGAHIQILLLTLFYRYMRPLIENNHIYIALPPLYKLTNKKTKKFYYAWTESQLEELKKENHSFEIQRYKGLGEMNADQLWETTMNPKTRLLINVSLDDFLLAEQQVNILMGDNPQLRKEWINANINFKLDDEE